MKNWLFTLIFLISCAIIAQNKDNNTLALTHSKLDKILIKEIKMDTLEWFFEDFKKSIGIDSSWQKLLTNNSIFDNQQNIYANDEYQKAVNVDLDTDTLKKRLELLNAKTPLDISYNPSLESVIQFYLKREKETTEQLMTLSQYYFPMFEPILDKYNIPLEIKYLALVESGLNPRAKSWAGATGLWQFMYSTGKMYDLEISSYVDERMDPRRSTEAAAKYLKQLHGIFEDWNLALAAYNSGPGNVNKAIRRSGGQKNYWVLRSYLPKETAGYIPSFLAMMYIFEYADEHQFQPQLPNLPYLATDTIQTKDLIKLKQVSNITNTNIEFLKFLNPSYKLGIIPFEPEKNYSLRLPYKAAGLFAANEDKIYDYAQKNITNSKEDLPQYYKVSDKVRYRVRAGDYLGRIAELYGVRVSEIRRWNGMPNDKISVGQRLTIYPRKANYTQSPTKEKNTAKKGNQKQISRNQKTYTVKPGDSLWSISKQFEGLSVQDLKKANNLKNNALKPGMILKISS